MRRAWPAGLLAVVLAVAAAASLLSFVALDDATVAVVDLEVGDCLDLPAGEESDEVLRFETVRRVDCDDPHEAEVVLTGLLNDGRDRPYPADDELFAEVDRRCSVADDPDDEFGMLPIAPDEATWDTFEGSFACVAMRFGGESWSGSVSDPGGA